MLVGRMGRWVLERQRSRPSLRQLAEAGGVAAPTALHYFGSRAGVMAAIFQSFQAAGEPRLRATREAGRTLEESVREFAGSFLAATARSPGFSLGDLLAVSLAEGLQDGEIGPAALTCIIDPAIDALQSRLQRHVQRGQMRVCDIRAAALMLLSPLLVAVLHQNHMGGRACNPVDIEQTAEEVCTAFLRAYGTPAGG
jgi:AcrR family transcriptional regulator